MTKSGILAAAAILASALASPATAQEVIYNPGYCAQFYPNANCQNRGPGSPYTGSYQRQAYRERRLSGPRLARQPQSLGRQRQLLAGRRRGRRRRRRGRHGGRHRHVPLRRRRICPPQRVRLCPRHRVPRRGWPAASLPVGGTQIAFGKGGWKAAFFRAGQCKARAWRFWPFAAKSDIRAAEERTTRRIYSPLTGRFDSPV